MTNAERFIGDEDEIDTFIEEFYEFACSKNIAFKYFYLRETLIEFFKSEVRTPLTEDERAILSNIDENEYQKIARQDGALFLISDNVYGGRDTCYMFGTIFKSDLFQFIKDGEEYEIKELLGDKK